MTHKSGIISGSFLIVIALLLGLIACNADSNEEAISTATDIKPEETIAPLEDAQGETSVNQVESSEAAGTTPSSIDEPTPQLEGVAAKSLVNLNVRQGPGTNYAIVGNIPAESQITIIGRNADGSWLRVESAAGESWISGTSDLVAVDSTLLAGLPVISAPPLAFDADNPNVKRILNEIPLVVYHGGRHTCASHGGLNNLFDVANGNVLGPHSGDFVLGQDNVLFEYSNGTVQLIKEDSIARFENGEKYLSFEEAMQRFASGEIVWTGSVGDWPARGVNGCDLSASP